MNRAEIPRLASGQQAAVTLAASTDATLAIPPISNQGHGRRPVRRPGGLNPVAVLMAGILTALVELIGVLAPLCKHRSRDLRSPSWHRARRRFRVGSPRHGARGIPNSRRRELVFASIAASLFMSIPWVLDLG